MISGFYHSSAIAFNLLICFVPFLLLLLSLVGTYLYSSREVLSHIRHYLETVAPSLDPKITRNILQITQTRKIVGILGIGGLLWTSTWVFGSLRIALNVIFQVEEGRGIVKGKAIDLLMIFLAGIALLMSMTLTSAVTFLQSYRLPAAINMAPFIQWILKYPIPFFLTFWMFFWVYEIIPRKKSQDRTRPQSGPLFQSPLGSRQTTFRVVCPACGKVLCGLWLSGYDNDSFPLDLLLLSHSSSRRRNRRITRSKR